MTFVNHGIVDRHLCIIDCIRRYNCQLINYDRHKGRCFFSQGPCINLVRDEQYAVIFFGRLTAEQCLRWVPVGGHTVERMVSSPDCEENPAFSEPECYVGRLKSAPHIIPGKFIPDQGIIYTILDGVQHTTGIQEILDVFPVCQTSWVSYTAGNVLPTKAVIGGHLQNENLSRLYVVRGPIHGKIIIGYYDIAARKAYIEWFGVNELKQVEMLVLV